MAAAGGRTAASRMTVLDLITVLDLETMINPPVVDLAAFRLAAIIKSEPWCLESRATGIGAASARTTAVGSRSHSSPTIGRPSRWAQSQGELDMPGIGFWSTPKGEVP